MKTEKRQKVKEEFEDEGDNLDDSVMDDNLEPEMGDDMGDEMGGDDLNAESDVPPEMNDAAGGEGMADDIRITIGGQEYMLVPASDAGEEGAEMGDDMGGDENLPMDSEMGGDELPPDNEMGEVGAEDDDVTNKPQQESKKNPKAPMKEGKKVNYDKIIDKALSMSETEKTARVQKALAMMEKAKAELNELFTGDYVQNKGGQALSGLDFSSVRGDTDYAVVARAATGKQYTPTDNPETEFEPKGKDKKSEAFKAWLAAQKAKFNEEEGTSDPGKDSESFNKNDTIDKNIDGLEDFPAMPEIVGDNPDVISQYAKTAEARKARQQGKKVNESEQPVKFPSKEVRADIENALEESFNFKDFISGKYQSK